MVYPHIFLPVAVEYDRSRKPVRMRPDLSDRVEIVNIPSKKIFAYVLRFMGDVSMFSNA